MCYRSRKIRNYAVIAYFVFLKSKTNEVAALSSFKTLEKKKKRRIQDQLKLIRRRRCHCTSKPANAECLAVRVAFAGGQKGGALSAATVSVVQAGWHSLRRLGAAAECVCMCVWQQQERDKLTVWALDTKYLARH